MAFLKKSLFLVLLLGLVSLSLTHENEKKRIRRMSSSAIYMSFSRTLMKGRLSRGVKWRLTGGVMKRKQIKMKLREMVLFT
uniref:Antimicrobial/opiod peptide Pv_1.8 n=1 Tax=Trachycephalus venulosus TaxID=213803 RepID=Q719L6_9NEOB|nr:antimicrobial/opiod peptide Pv_1.8 [Trachycephalus venulosus]